ncbi:hypothetical protein DFH07DRAFT_680907, partial [Mycena maculata]
LDVPLPTVLALLRDPPAMVRLNPLLVSVDVDPVDPTKYTIVDNLALPFGYRTQITYEAKITVHDDGMHAESAAGAGTRTASKYTARAISENTTEIVEEVHVKSFFLLLPFIRGVIAKAHNESLDRLTAKLE